MMYPEIILDLYRNPSHKGTVAKADIKARDANPLCGDVIEISAKSKDGTIIQLKHAGHGCAISQAAAELLAQHLEGKSLDDVKHLTKEDVLKMLDIDISPVRLKCALLALKVIKMAVYEKLGDGMSKAMELLDDYDTGLPKQQKQDLSDS